MTENVRYDEHEIEKSLENFCRSAGFKLPTLFCLTSYNSINNNLFGLIKDLRINLVFCNFDYIQAGLKNYSAKHEFQFQQDMKLKELLFYQYHVSNFVVRFRSVGDKVMRLLLYLHAKNSDIKKFDHDRSKLKTFIKMCERNKVLEKYKDMANIFRSLDEQYRTDEIHGMGGRLRNSIIAKKSFSVNDPIIQIGNYWNIFTCDLGILKDIYTETLNYPDVGSGLCPEPNIS